MTILTRDVDTITHVSVDRLVPGLGNLRDGEGNWPEVDSELAASIKSFGVLEPLIVRLVKTGAEEGMYEVIAGHRRAAAARSVKLATIPAVALELSDTKALQVALVENLQRQDLTPLEEARGLRLLLDTGMPQTTAAKEIGRSQAHVSKRLSLLKLPPHAQAYLDAGKLRVEDALALAKLDAPQIERALYQIEQLAYRRAGEVEQLIRQIAEPAAKGKARAGKDEPTGKARAGKDEPEVRGQTQTWELAARDLVVFRELARKRLTLDGARRRLTRSAGLRGLEWDPKDLADLLALAIGDTRARRRSGRPKGKAAKAGGR
jgi:ParB/RepB/Spo0J family partition protein